MVKPVGRLLLLVAVAGAIGVVVGLQRRARRRDPDEPEGRWGLAYTGLSPAPERRARPD